MIINIQIRRKKASSPAARIVCGNTDYQIAFTFDSEWDAYETKTARFIWNGQYADVVFTGNVCDVPKITNATLCMVGVFAGDLHTTTPAYIKCDRSILCGDGSPAEPSEDVYAQIMELLNGGAGGGGVPSGGSAHQVLTTDADGNAGWEDKPFYDGGARVTYILPESTLAFSSDYGGFVLPDFLSLTSGLVYTVTYNGVEYKCTAQEIEEDGVVYGILGNIDAMMGGTGTGEPFVVMAYPESIGFPGVVIDIAGETEITVSISREEEVIRKLDNKFLDLEWFAGEVDGAQLAAEKTVTNNTGTPTETTGGFPDLTSSMVYEGMGVAVYFDGKRYKCSVFSFGGSLFAGNGADLGLENTGEPFLLNFVSTRTNLSGFEGEHVASVYALEANRLPAKFMPTDATELILNSAGGKQFKITVDDSGNLTAAEVTE